MPGTFSDKDLWGTDAGKQLRALIEACWSHNPDDRPTASQMLQAIHGESVTAATEGETGLKADRVGILGVLQPDGPLRKGVQVTLKKWMESGNKGSNANANDNNKA